jgi:uncharacterized protein with HEPN domain
MPRSVDLYLSDLLEASNDILRFTQGVDFAAYESNRLLRAAVERLFTIVGDQYATVDDEEVWSTVRSKLPSFRDQIAALIQARKPPA